MLTSKTLVLTLLMFAFIAGLLYGMPRVIGNGRVLSEKRLWSRVVPYFVLLSLSWWGMRFLMLYLEVPARWQRGKAPLAPLFDPTHFASDLGGGLFRSLGDTFITGIFILLFAIWLFRLVRRFSTVWNKEKELDGRSSFDWIRVIAGFVVAILVSLSVIHILGSIIQRAVLDSTLDYAERSGIIPDRLVFFMFCTLMIIGIASVIIQVAFTWYSVSQARLHISRPKVANLIAAIVLIANGLAIWGYIVQFSSGYHVPVIIALIVTTCIWGGSFIISRYPSRVAEWIHFRAALLGILVLAVPLYALLAEGIEAQTTSINGGGCEFIYVSPGSARSICDRGGVVRRWSKRGACYSN